MSFIGIIGGSGLYNLEGISNVEEIEINTPFGKPSDRLIKGRIENKDVVFLARHGKGHRILPSEINFKANIYAMKSLGVRKIISASAVGSLKIEHKPMDIVIPDQFIDRTYARESTFFGNGIVIHISFAEPICKVMAQAVKRAADKQEIPVKLGGTYVCMEGPQFSTKAESFVYRSWGADLIGMTNLQEAKLAREAEIAYVTIALVTDYDCWHESEEAVTVEMVLKYFNQNIINAKKIIKAAVLEIDAESDCRCHHALEGAILSDKSIITEEIKEKLKPIIGKYF